MYVTAINGEEGNEFGRKQGSLHGMVRRKEKEMEIIQL